MAPKNNSQQGSSQKPNGTYAIVEASGKQFWLEPNRYYDLDRIKADINQVISLEKVLLLTNEKETIVGSPYVKGASVQLKVLEHRRGTKLIVYKMRPKKKTRRKNGHRQELTRVMVESISTQTQSSASSKKQPEKTTKAKSDATPSKIKKTTKTTTSKS